MRTPVDWRRNVYGTGPRCAVCHRRRLSAVYPWTAEIAKPTDLYRKNIALASIPAAPAIFISATRLLRPRLVYDELSSSKLLAVERIDACLHLILRDVYKSEAFAFNDSHALGVEIAKEVKDVSFIGCIGKIPDIQTLVAHYRCYSAKLGHSLECSDPIPVTQTGLLSQGIDSQRFQYRTVSGKLWR